MKHARADYDRIQDPAVLIPSDEPVFLLRGQDRYAALTVEIYANLVEANGGDPGIGWLARHQANMMRTWNHQKTKEPDLP